jgi:hypothetical protein
MAAAEAQEPALQDAASRRLVEQIAHAEATPPRPVDGGLPMLARHGAPQVPERPDRAGNRDPVAASGIAGRQRPRTMNPDPAVGTGLPGIRDSDLDRAGATRGEVPELGGTLVAEHRIAPACLHCRKPMALGTDRSVADRVNAVVTTMKAAGAYPTVDAGVAESAGQQLEGGEHAVVALRERNDQGFWCACERLLSDTESKSSQAPNFAPSLPSTGRKRRAVE